VFLVKPSQSPNSNAMLIDTYENYSSAAVTAESLEKGFMSVPEFNPTHTVAIDWNKYP